MNPGGRVTIKVGGTIWSRFLVAVAVMRVFWLQFVLAILAWMVAGVVLHETPLFAGAVLFVIGTFMAVNAAGIDPGQLLIRGEITFTPTGVSQKMVWGSVRERGWVWVRSAHEVAGRLHLVLGSMHSRAGLPFS